MRDENHIEEKEPTGAFVHTWDDIIYQYKYRPEDMVVLLARGSFTIRDEKGRLYQSDVSDAHEFCVDTGKGWSTLHEISPSHGELDSELLKRKVTSSVY